MRRKQPCFDFIRNVMFNLEKNSPVEEDKKKSNLLSNLSVDNVAAENEEEKASRTHLKLWKKLRRLLTTKPVQNISRTQDMSSLSSHKNLLPRPIIHHLYSYSEILWLDNNYCKDNDYLTMRRIDNVMDQHNIYV